MLNLFQVRLRARDVPEGHVAEGTVHAEPEEVHPGDEFTVIIDVRFAEGGAPAVIEAKVSPPEDVTAEPAHVELGPDGATITIPAAAEEEVELGTYYLQVVYSDEEEEHFEAEAPLEVKRHWVRVGQAVAVPARVSPGDPVDVTVPLSFEGTARVRGHVRGRLVPEDWDGSDEHVIKLARERSSVAGEREQSWHVRLPRGVPEGRYNADIEFSSGEGTARRRTKNVLLLVPQRGIDASKPTVSPTLMAPEDDIAISINAENIGREDLLVRVGGELVPETGGTTFPLEERDLPLAPGEAQDVVWAVKAPERHGRWIVRTRARADRTDGADPPLVFIDVRPPNQVHVVGAVPARPWAAPGERVDVALQLMDSGSRPGCDASITVALEGEGGETGLATWEGRLEAELIDSTVAVEVPRPPPGADEEDGEVQASTRFALVVSDRDGNELLRVPGAVAVRRRVRIEPRAVTADPDPTKLADSLLPGERVVRTVDAGDLTLVELTSGCRVYARGDLVAGVDREVPMDDAFWDEALNGEVTLYTDLKKGIQRGALAARAEAILMRTLAGSLSEGKGSASGLVKDTRELAKTLDPDRRARGVSPRGGPLAPLAAWLADPEAHPDGGREAVIDLRKALGALQKGTPGERATEEGAAAARAAAMAAADHLDHLADLLTRAWERDRMDVGTLQAAAALVAASGVAQVELHRLRRKVDPWASPDQLSEAGKVALQSMSTQLAALVEVIARHRIRRSGCSRNTAQRAAQAAVTRELEVAIGNTVGHSGDATEVEVELRNHSAIDLDLRLNVALPSGAWAVLEPRSRGAQGLVYVGPVHVPAHSQETVTLLVYVPTTVRLDSYIFPVEVVPEPREIIAEQRGGAQ